MPLGFVRPLATRLPHFVVAAALAAGGLLATAPAPSYAATYYVSPSGNDANDCLSPATACLTITAAIAKASSGDTISIAAGTYVEGVNINKNNLTITGAGATSTIISGPKTGGSDTVTFSGTGNVLEHVQITREGNNPTDWASNTRSQGITFNAGGNTVRHALITKNRTGVLFANGSGNQLLNSTVTNNRTGLHFINTASSNAVVQGNQITNNWTIGILFREDASNHHTITNNLITGNWYSQIEDRGNPAGIFRNVSRNNFGTATLTIAQAANSGEPGYSAQIPVEFGGTATPPPNPKTFVINTVCLTASGPPPCTDPGGIGTLNPNRLDFSPYLMSGTPNPLGFTANYDDLYVDARSASIGGTPHIQEALAIVPPGGRITAVAGTYTERNTVNKSITLRGAQHGVDARTRSGQPETILNHPHGAFDVSADDVVIDGFTFQNATNPSWQGVAVYLHATASGYTIQNNIFTENIFGLYLNASGVKPTVVRRNRFANNNQPGPASGNGIYSDQGAANILVEENAFTQQDNSAIVLTAVPPTVNSHITIRRNEVSNSAGMAIFHSANVTVTENTFVGATSTGVAAAGGTTNVAIVGNSFSNGQFRSIGAFDNWGAGPNINLTIAGNTILHSVGALQLDRPAIELVVASGVSIRDNVITVSGAGSVTHVQAIVVGGASTTGVTIQNNGLNATGVSGLSELTGIKLKNDLAGSATVAIRNNRIAGFQTGIHADGLANGAGITIFDNSLAGNSVALHNSGAAITAEGNWWGSHRGPTTGANPGGDGAALTGAVDFSPWLGDGTNYGGNPGFLPNQFPKYGLAAVLVFTTQPFHNGTFQQALTTQPVVQAQDGLGHRAINFQGAVTLTPNPPPGVTGAAVTGPNPISATDGIAAFSAIGVNHAGNGWTLTATASALANATSSAFDVAKASQSIDFPALANKLTTDPPFPITATASSGLPVTFSAAAQCTISGTVVTVTGAGICAITAYQGGNGDFFPAGPVSRLFNITEQPVIGPATSIQVTATPVGDVRGDPGATVVYSVTVVNQTGQASGFDFQNVSGGGAFPMSGLPLTGVPILAGGSSTQLVGIVIPTNATPGQISINKVRVSTVQGSVTYEQTVDLVAVVNEGAPDLRVRISRTPPSPEPGSLVRYTVTYTSPVRSSPNVVLKVTLPNSQLIEFVSATDGVTPDGSGVLTWPNVANLPANTAVSKEIVVRVRSGAPAGSLLRLSAEVTSSVVGQNVSGENRATDDAVIVRRLLVPFTTVQTGNDAQLAR
jgi:hypothetical protein